MTADFAGLVDPSAEEEGREAECLACGTPALAAFYEARGIPSHSCVLMPDRDAAVSYPSGDVLLALCQACGFVQNVRFEPDLVDYTQDYEDSQASSNRFNQFTTDLAETLIRRHDLSGKHILEVGSGKGDFLLLLADLGDVTGTGIDPGYKPDRHADRAAARLEFIKDFYSEDYVDLSGDLVATRHTLEHIAPVAEFIRLLGRSAAATPGSVLFIEVPDVRRVLREGAFWDIYYEHCSYFSLGSLGRLMRAGGFTVEHLELGFDDQYLLADGRLDDGTGAAAHPAEEELAALASEAQAFGRNSAQAIDGWQGKVQSAFGRGERVVVWGGGSKGVAFLTTLGLSDEIRYVVDINPLKQGMFMPGTGQEVIAPDVLVDGFRPDRVIVMNPIYRDEITQQLEGLGLSPIVESV